MATAVTPIYARIVTGLVAALAAGCTLIPAYQRPAAPIATQYPAVTSATERAPSPVDAATERAPSPVNGANLGWRTVFVDQRLQALIELALGNNRDLRVAALNVEQSQAQYRITRANSLPTVNAGAGYTATGTQNITTHQVSASVGVSAYVLDFFGRVRSLKAQALENYLATTEAQRSARLSLVAEVATQYFSWLQAEAQLALARQTLAAEQESLRVSKAIFDAGGANELDVRTAEGQVQTSQINLLDYERQYAQTLNALELLLGSTLPENLPPALPLQASGHIQDVPPGVPSDLLQNRPDILQAEHTLRAANANIGAARAAFFPSITLTGSVGSASPQLSGLFKSGSGNWNFSPQLNLPLFTGGANRASLDVARVSARIDVAQYEKAIQTAFREVADALAARGSYGNIIGLQSAAIETQQRRLDLANLRYRQGEDSYLNVLSAQQSLYNAQQGLLNAQYNVLASQISLYQALGGGWQ
jgi:multidrug efflux system outer membrane protein